MDSLTLNWFVVRPILFLIVSETCDSLAVHRIARTLSHSIPTIPRQLTLIGLRIGLDDDAQTIGHLINTVCKSMASL